MWTPPIESATVSNVRTFLKQERDERREILERVGQHIHHEELADEQSVRTRTLGCCREVGRASFILSTAETRILVSCGDKLDAEGEVPYLQAPEVTPLNSLDAVMLTHSPQSLRVHPLTVQVRLQ